MSKRIVIIQGHPDHAEPHFCHAIAEAYASGARRAGHEVREVDIARMEFPVLRNAKDWKEHPAPAAIAAAQQDIRWAEHLVIVYPLWMGDMPALLKAFLEQLLRPGFALDYVEGSMMPKKLLKGRSGRVVVTMGMPGFFYKLFYRAHTLKSLERNILAGVGIRPVRSTVIGSVEEDAAARADWLSELEELGAAAQ
jgi:putative NADPH-quinone reductase